jgi:hypothetical protein
LLSGRLAQNPAYGVYYIGFTTAVRANDTDQLAGDWNVDWVNERFKASKLDMSESQWETDPY